MVRHGSDFVKGNRHVASTIMGLCYSIGSGFGSDNLLTAQTNGDFPRVKFSLVGGSTCWLYVVTDVIRPFDERLL